MHLYGGNGATLAVEGDHGTPPPGDRLSVVGAVRIEVDTEAPVELTLKLRIPGWARSRTSTLNGQPVDWAPGARLPRREADLADR